jgi:signal recognition particle receptor subunit beta
VGSVNFHTKEIVLKVVYYGPGLCGKTTTLHALHRALPEDKRPNLVSLATETDRTLYFDYLPLLAARVRDYAIRLQLYTVPGQVFYRSTREIVLRGADGLVFVADSQREMRDGNLVSLDDLRENLEKQGRSIDSVPLVFQYNKRDLSDILEIDELQSQLNYLDVPFFPTIAAKGEGVGQALTEITKRTVKDFVTHNKL